ncbi:MAG: hypothetical protein LBV18_07255 [Alistipes sp.]|jgi:hypothetical protein|nr:hypothetical protein [Alistipes sp.]
MGLFCRKYKFSPERYAGTFLGAPAAETNRVAPADAETTFAPGPAAEMVYCFWTGDNPLTPNRVASLETMREHLGVEVKLITPANLGDYILPDHPLHPGYEFLSLNHRSDYLRCYFMHHHGGGYGDVKRYSHPWKGAFDRLNGSDKWGLGYGEESKRGVARVGGAIGQDMRKHWRLLVGNGSFIFRPRTPMTAEWYGEVTRRMDGYLDELRRNPGDMWGKNEGYPIPWTGMQGDIFHPLSLKYHDRLLKDDSIKPSFKEYR